MMVPAYVYRATLNRVIDGDTFVLDVDVGFRVVISMNIRLKGLYAPELNTPEGIVARERAIAVLSSATTIIVATQKTKAGNDVKSLDRYVADMWVDDRLLAEVLSARASQ